MAYQPTPAHITDRPIEGVRSDHLDRLGEHVAAALAQQEGGRSRAALAEVERVLADWRALSELT
jgi:hypothetical protein